MKKVLLSLIMLVTLSATAQIYPDGTVIQSFSATDINNNFFSSTIATNNGKHIIVDISATWCTICWNYHNTKVLEDYNTQYGPVGTGIQDGEVLFYEGDAATNNNDLNGVGTNTVGDWVMGTSYKIFNEATPSNVKSSFSANGVLGYPSVFLVCSDKKMYRVSTSLNTVSALRSFVNNKCGTAPTSANTVHAHHFDYSIYPNPSSSNISLDVSLDKPVDFYYEIFNSVGQRVDSKKMGIKDGKINLILETAEFPSGMYFLNLVVDGEKITERIIIE